MKIFDLIGTCLRNLLRRKVRTLLTVIGVVVGCCAIIVMLSLGIAVDQNMSAMLAQMGDLNVITVQGDYGGGMMVMKAASGGVAIGGSSSGGKTSEKPKLNDEALATFQELDGVEVVSPFLQSSYENFTIYGGKNDRYRLTGQVTGMDLASMDKFGYQLKEGALPTGTDFKGVCIMGQNTAYQFMDTKRKRNNMVDNWPDAQGNVPDPFVNPMEDPMELTINKGAPDNETGSYKSAGKNYEHKLKTAAVFVEDWNKGDETSYGIVVDINWLKQLITDYNKVNGVKASKDGILYSSVRVRVKDLNNVDDVQQKITDMGYESSSMETYRKSMQDQVKSQQMFLGGLAAVSLFVAALGITNTMIMSIYERTREIGVMKVLGCVVGNIRTIFLMEAGCIGFLGGCIGVVLSYIISFLVNTFPSLVSAAGGDMGMGGSVSVIPPWLVLLALAFSTAIGLISGLQPANRAVKISALEAIKQD